MTDPSPLSRSPREDGAASGSQLSHLVRQVLRVFGRGKNGDASLRESLEEVIEEHEEAESTINPEERLMLMNILAFGDMRVDDVMVPRADVSGIEVETPFDAVIDQFREAAHSRMPVYRETLDDVVGVVHIKDLMRYWGAESRADLGQMARRPLFVPPSMPVLDLLLQMRATRKHMAIVVDEYGGTDGLVTIEDLVEEIVGDIQDEHDVVEGPMMIERPDGSIEADARTEIEEFEARVGCDLLPTEEDEEIDTLGGLVFSMLGRVPQRGEVVQHACGLAFEVIDADPRRIKRLRVRPVPARDDAAP
jgi:CBS domain containing-hemolysin-like protein